jgi:hypothetical protein
VSAADDELLALRPPDLRTRVWALTAGANDYRLTRALLLFLLGIVYLFAFIGLLRQGDALLGSHGLTPIARFLPRVVEAERGFWDAPSLFWWSASDASLHACAWLGVLLSLCVVTGFGNAPVLLALWVLYGSFVHTGQLWFSFGWEIQLLETGFIAIFLAPPLDSRPAHARPPPMITIWLYRWLIFRIMLGAGLIKLRGDPCWQDLSCLDFHFETQPIPNPLSPWFHRLPHGVHAAGVLFNHVVEVVLPWLVFGPRRARLVAGLGMLSFQVMLIVSGNLAFLNWLTVVPIVACFDDAALGSLLPQRLFERIRALIARAPTDTHLAQRVCASLFAVTVAWLSIDIVENLASSHQVMNGSFDPLSLVNTYGAFGSVGNVRNELIIEGTSDPVLSPNTRWQAYELPCKPGALTRRPCVLGPYHLRLDWLIWFAAMHERGDEVPWMVHVVWKLLNGDRGIVHLLAYNPFPGKPPRYVRVRRFEYRFAPEGSPNWWLRDHEQTWLPPLDTEDPSLRAYVEANGWPALIAR